MTSTNGRAPKHAAHFGGASAASNRAQGTAQTRRTAPTSGAGFQRSATTAAVPVVGSTGTRAPLPGQTGAVGMKSSLSGGRVSGRSAQATHRAGNNAGSRRRRKQQNTGPSPKIVGIVVVAVVLCVGGFLVARALMSGSSSSSSSETQEIVSGQSVELTIPDGSGASAIAQLLFDNGVIANKGEFLSQVQRSGAESSLQSGTYELVTGDSLSNIVDLLCSGPNATGYTITIPEGYTVASIAAAYESAFGLSSEEFIAQAKASNYVSDYSFLEGVTNDSLEGFLFPKTYDFAGKEITIDLVIRTMLDQFQAELGTLDLSYPESRGLSVAEMVNLASIVEKESTASTQAKVAAVFYNRLGNFGDPNYGYLQSDATTAYSVGHDPSGAEVHDESDPYSTYAYQGLPPTPICNPGLAALQAVCSPDQEMLDGKYYYFYFWTNSETNQIEYAFSQTYAEHLQAIEEHS